MNYTSILYLFATFSNLIPDYFILPFTFIYAVFRKIELNNNAFIILFSVNILTLINMCLNSDYFNSALYLHLFILLCITVLFKDKFFSMNIFLRTVKIITLMNFILLFTYFTEFGKRLFFNENLLFYRFESIYLEPSLLALFSVFNLIVFYVYDNSSTKRIFIFLNLLIIFFSFSGSGIAILVIIFLIYGIATVNRKYLILITISLISSVIIISSLESSPFVDRINNFIGFNFDNSTILRFIAPFEFFNNLINYNLSSLFVGIGDPRLFIENNFPSFHLFFLWDGTPAYNLNNGYMVGFSIGGVVLLLSFIFYLLIAFKSINPYVLLFILLFPFFSGHFVSIMFWFLISFYSLNFNKI